MSENSGSFLTKSIILLTLFLVCIGTSMWLGKELGRKIMDSTRVNIEQKFPDSEITDNDNAYVMDFVAGDRSSFGYDSNTFATSRFNEEWADPPEDELVSGEEGPSVTVTPLDPDDPDAVNNDPDSLDPDADEPDDDGGGIFDLGDSTTYRIQVGTFTDKDNAEGVWNDLTRAEYNASIATFTDENDDVHYRVTVGVYHTLEEANRIADEIRSLGFSGWVQEIMSE